MTLILHIIIALASLVYAGYVFFFPSPAKMKASYGLVAATLATGFYLVGSEPAHMMQACTSGLIYLGVVFTLILSARHKLAKED